MAKADDTTSTDWIWLRVALELAFAAFGSMERAKTRLRQWMATGELPWDCMDWEALDDGEIAELRRTSSVIWIHASVAHYKGDPRFWGEGNNLLKITWEGNAACEEVVGGAHAWGINVPKARLLELLPHENEKASRRTKPAELEVELEAQLEAELEAQLEAKQKAKRDAKRKAERKAELKAKREAKREAELEAELKAKREAVREAEPELMAPKDRLAEPPESAKVHGTAEWIAAEAERMKKAGEIPSDIRITEFARMLESRMRKAAASDKSLRPIKWHSIKNRLRDWGLWPVTPTSNS